VVTGRSEAEGRHVDELGHGRTGNAGAGWKASP
jgi:hypothetical protein